MGAIVPFAATEWRVVADFGAVRLFLAANPHREPRVQGTGWKRWVWTRDEAAAVRFEQREDAERFAWEWLPDGWTAVRVVEEAAVAA